MEFSRQESWSGLLQGSFQPKEGTQVSCIVGEFFTVSATREAKGRLLHEWKKNTCKIRIEKMKSYFSFLQVSTHSYWVQSNSCKCQPSFRTICFSLSARLAAPTFLLSAVHQLWMLTLLQDNLLFSTCQTSSTNIPLAFSSDFWHNPHSHQLPH